MNSKKIHVRILNVKTISMIKKVLTLIKPFAIIILVRARVAELADAHV